MKQIYIIIALAFSSLTFGQTGMGTPTPRGALDINRPLTNTFGLVLPTNSNTANMINPQGGTIAEGTIMYDSQAKCVKFYTGTSWSNCLVDSPPSTSTGANCAVPGFIGTYKSGVRLSGASFGITITNNSAANIGPINFQNSDVLLTGIGGINVSSVSPASVTLTPGQTQVITYHLSGTPNTHGVLTGILSKLNVGCTSNVNVRRTVRFAHHGYYTTGSSPHANFNSQLQNPANYGRVGTYQGNFEGFAFTDIGSALSALTAKDLIDKYDIICVREHGMSAADAKKLKDFVDGGGVLTAHFENAVVGAAIFAEFGGTGSLAGGYGGTTSTTNTNIINNGVFGDTRNVTITGAGTTALFTTSQLPPNSTVLASNTTGPTVYTTGSGGRAIFIWDEDVFTRPAVDGTIIDTNQEKFLHNIIANALQKAGL